MCLLSSGTVIRFLVKVCPLPGSPASPVGLRLEGLAPKVAGGTCLRTATILDDNNCKDLNHKPP